MKYVKKIGILWVIILISIIIVACGSSSNSSDKESVSEKAEDTPSEKLTDLTIGSSIKLKGVTVTVNGVKDGPETSGSPTYEVDVTYKNDSGKNINASPYDWTTVLHTGSDKAHVGGSSFDTKSIAKGEEWNGVVTLWKGQSPEKIKFESSFLNIGGEKKQATWLINDEK